MVEFPKKIFVIAAGLVVAVGLVRLFSDFYDETSSVGSKENKVASSSATDAYKDYSGCLANLNGLEKSLIEAAIESKIDPKLLLAVMKVESGCSSATRSDKGAVGLMQLLPSTARSVGSFNANRPQENIRAGAKYLRELKDQFGPDLKLTLAAYNAGPAAVRKYKGVPPYRETRNYVAKVMKVYDSYSL